MGHADLERWPVEQRGRQDVECVEPAAGLADVLDDEVAGVVVLEPVFVLERVVHLGEGHRARLEPAVERLGDAPHHRLPGGVVGVRAHEIVDRRPVQVGREHAEVALHVGQRAVHVEARIRRVVGLPHRDGRAPEAVAADRPVTGVRDPLAEAALLHMPGHPGDLLVQLHHSVTELRDLHEPARHCPVDERIRAAPAVRIAVVVGLVAHQLPRGTQVLDDHRVGVEHEHVLVRRHLAREAAAVVDGVDHADAGRVGDDLVLLAEGRGDVDDAGAVLGGDVVGGENLERVRMCTEEWEQRLVAAADKRTSLHRAHLGRVLELLCVRAHTGGREDVALGRSVGLRLGHDGVVDVRVHGRGQVRRQRPRRRRPGQQHVAVRRAVVAEQREHDRDGRVLALPVHVVHTRLGVAQGGLTPPAIGQHAVALVDEALVEECLERPHDRLHVGQVERLVVVGEVDPAGLAGDIALPLLGVAQYAAAARGVELGDAERSDLLVPGHAELLFGLDLGGQAVGVPAEAALDLLAAHGLVAGDGVLDVPGEQVAVVGEAVGEGRTVVEDVLVGARVMPVARLALVDGGLERLLPLPLGQDLGLDDGERGARRDGGVGLGVGLVGGHLLGPLCSEGLVSLRNCCTGTSAVPGDRGTTPLASAPAGRGLFVGR